MYTYTHVFYVYVYVYMYTYIYIYMPLSLSLFIHVRSLGAGCHLQPSLWPILNEACHVSIRPSLGSQGPSAQSREFPKKRGFWYRPQIVGLFVQGHLQGGPPIYRSSPSKSLEILAVRHLVCVGAGDLSMLPSELSWHQVFPPRNSCQACLSEPCLWAPIRCVSTGPARIERRSGHRQASRTPYAALRLSDRKQNCLIRLTVEEGSSGVHNADEPGQTQPVQTRSTSDTVLIVYGAELVYTAQSLSQHARQTRPPALPALLHPHHLKELLQRSPRFAYC